jgi:GT2 family glycosyltransferase
MKSVSVLVIAPKPNEITTKAIEVLKKQKCSGKKEVLVISEDMGLAENVNYGIKKSKYDIIVTLHHDCIPVEEDWLEKLVAPLKNKEVVAATSKVKLPDEVWGRLGKFTKSIMLKERGTITPLLDGKGCAYKKKTLEKIGLLDEKRFKIAGEDFDMYIKLIREGKIAYPDVSVMHYHPTTLFARIKKVGDVWGRGDGANVRIHGKKMPEWKARIAKATPVIGIAVLIVSFPFKKSFKFYPPYLLLTPIIHMLYIYGFWKGFISGKQTI